MKIYENYDLKEHNTFGIAARSKYFVKIKHEKEALGIKDILPGKKRFILGGGSNILFVDNYDGLIIKNEIEYIQTIKEDDNFVYVKAGGGVVWDKLVEYTVERDLHGIENLSLIPGTVGAAPVQNIGAYGVELNDSFSSLEAVIIENKVIKKFTKEECNFSYRNSIFKNELKNKLFITSVTLKLNKREVYNLQYSALKNFIESKNIRNVNLRDIRNAVIEIRNSKLPDPDKLGNSGSFFKNPVINRRQLEELKENFTDVVFYPVEEGNYKVPAGWLIEKAGFKGKKVGNVGSYEKQALVIVNYGGATGKEIYNFSENVRENIFNKFKIILDYEVNLIT